MILAISQPVPGGPGNALAERLRSPVVDLGSLLQRARDDWKGQPGTLLALSAAPAGDVYLRGGPARLADAPVAEATSPSMAPGDAESAMSDADRRRIQTRLRALGLYEGETDGVFGVLTRDAIRRYQAAKGLPPTGRLGEAEAGQLLFSKTAMPAR